jgi:hypothetical protein
MKTKKTTKPKPASLQADPDVKQLTLQVNTASKGLVTSPENPEQAATAVEQRNKLKEIAKDIGAKKKGIVGPLNTALKRVRDLFKPVEEKLEQAIADVTDGLVAYQEQALKAVEIKKERLEDRLGWGEITLEKADALLEKTRENVGAGIVPTRPVRVVKVIDETLVPREYLMVDFAKIKADALAGKVIPGVVVETEQQVFVKR